MSFYGAGCISARQLVSVCEGSEAQYLCGGDIGGRLDQLDRVANLLNGVDQRADVASDVVEKMDSRHDGVRSTEKGGEAKGKRESLRSVNGNLYGPRCHWRGSEPWARYRVC